MTVSRAIGKPTPHSSGTTSRTSSLASVRDQVAEGGALARRGAWRGLAGSACCVVMVVIMLLLS